MAGSGFRRSDSFIFVLLYAFIACQAIAIVIYMLPSSLRIDNNINCYNKNYNINYKHMTFYSILPEIFFGGNPTAYLTYFTDSLCDLSKYRNEMLRDIRRSKNTNDLLVYLFAKAMQLFLTFFREILVIAITVHFQFLIKTVLYNLIPTSVEDYLFKSSSGKSSKSKSARRKSKSRSNSGSSSSNNNKNSNPFRNGKYSDNDDDNNDSDSDAPLLKHSSSSSANGKKIGTVNSTSNSNLFGLREKIMSTVMSCSLESKSTSPGLERDPALGLSYDELDDATSSGISSSSRQQQQQQQQGQPTSSRPTTDDDEDDFHVFDPVFGVIPAALLRRWQQQEEEMKAKIENARNSPRKLPPVRNSQ